MTMDIKTIIKYVKTTLELSFIALFIYWIFPLPSSYAIALRIFIITSAIYGLIIVFRRRELKNLLNLEIVFFIAFNISQSIKNIYTAGKPYDLIFEGSCYILTLFILLHNAKHARHITTGLVLFIVYSFKIFDANLLPNEFSLVHALSLILALIWIENIAVKKELSLGPRSIITPMFVFILTTIVSTITAVCPYNSFVQLAIMLNFIFIGFLMASYIKNTDEINLIIRTFFFIGCALLILAYQEILRKFLNGGVDNAMSRIFISLNSPPFRIHPNSIAGYFTTLLCLIIASLYIPKPKLFKISAIFFITALSFVLILTYSKLGILSCVIALVLLLVLRQKETNAFIKKRAPILILIIIFIAGLCWWQPIRNHIVERLSNIYSSAQTFYSCKTSLTAIKDKPLLGFGMDNYYILSKYAQGQIYIPGGSGITSTRNVVWTPSHSLYAGIAFGLGVIGLLAFLWLIISIILYSIKLNRNIAYDKHESCLLQGIFIAFTAVLIHGILSMTFHLTILPAFFWVLIGLIISIGNIANLNKFSPFNITPLKISLMLLLIILLSITIVANPIISEKKYNIALENFRKGDLNNALSTLNRAKIFLPINPKFYELSADIKSAEGLSDEAILYYKKASELKKDFAFYNTKIGFLYLQNNADKNALIEFDKAIQLDKYGVVYGEHFTDLGSLYKKLGNKTQAVTQFKKALFINPCIIHSSNDWPGFNYLDEIKGELNKDYTMLKDNKPLEAEQILFTLKHVNNCPRIK